MRIILAGPPPIRARLRQQLEHLPVTIVAEFATLGAARASGVDADAVLVDPARASSDGDEMEEALTPREVDVLELLAEGLSNKHIAQRLGISDQTVKFHVASLIGKLAAANRTDVVRRAVRRGLVAL